MSQSVPPFAPVPGDDGWAAMQNAAGFAQLACEEAARLLARVRAGNLPPEMARALLVALCEGLPPVLARLEEAVRPENWPRAVPPS